MADDVERSTLPIPGVDRPGPTVLDAKDPEATFPPRSSRFGHRPEPRQDHEDGRRFKSGEVNERISVQPTDSDGIFRVVDCKLMYNLATSSLSGVGTYTVSAVINGTQAATPPCSTSSRPTRS